ncbi:transposase [Streptomyces sp. NPDC013012]|uniref:transposase n=1 Tax=Streptomyces sp. NPDC013012 TaxID=3364860 RepID=UPI0036C3E9B4
MARGLLSEVPRKNLWQPAEFAGHPDPDRLQGFLPKACCDADELRDRVRALCGHRPGRRRRGADRGRDRRHRKGHQDRGRAAPVRRHRGRIENARVSVHLLYGSSRSRTLIDCELHLGRPWVGTTAAYGRRCAEQGTPPERATTVATKPELARRMLERALAAKVPFTYFLADEAHGRCRAPRA